MTIISLQIQNCGNPVLGTRSYLVVRGRVERGQWVEMPMIPLETSPVANHDQMNHDVWVSCTGGVDRAALPSLQLIV